MTLNLAHVEPRRRWWSTAAEDNTRFHSCQLRTKRGGIIGIGSPKLGSRTLDIRLDIKCWLVWGVLSTGATFRIWWKQHDSMDPSWLASGVQATAGARAAGVISGGSFLSILFTGWASQSTWVLLSTMSIPLWPQLTIFQQDILPYFARSSELCNIDFLH